jgi:outer membrane protein insertion porin family
MPPGLLVATLALLTAVALPARADEQAPAHASAPEVTAKPLTQPAEAKPADTTPADLKTPDVRPPETKPPEETGPAPDAGTLNKISVAGNRRVETDAIRSAFPIKVGDAYDKPKLKAGLIALWKMGYFSDLQLDVSNQPPPLLGQALVIIVKEKPAVHEVKLEGNEELSKEDLKDTLDVRPFQILDQELVRKSAKKVQDKYIEKGFFLAEVQGRIDPRPNNEVDVTIVISEHAKVGVREVRIVGNKAIAADELKSQMITQEGGVFSFLSGGGTYREDAFARDEYILQSMYYDRGFLYVKFGKPVIELSPDKRFIYITMSVDEGEPYDVGKIDISGDMLETKEKLREKITIKSGERFSRAQLTKDMQSLSDVYKDKGYAYANVSPLTAVDAEKRIVDLTFEMQKGNLVTIEKIEVVGNSKTRDKVVRRELRINEGDLYSSTEIRWSKARVQALGFFETVEINQRRGSGDDKMILEVVIKEKLTGTFQVGFGFTGGESFFGTAQLSQNNLLGYGTTASLALQLSTIRSLFQLSYLDPYLFDTKWTGSIDLYRSQLNYTGFQRNAYGGSGTAGYELYEDLRLFSTYTLEQVSVTATSASSQLLRNQFLSGRTSSIRVSFNYDKRDNRLFPSDGHLESASAEFATREFGSENLFERFKYVQRYYHPLGFGLVFKVNINIGYIRALDPVNRPVAISEKFFEGGINSLRGYVLRSISPTIKIASTLSPTAGTADFQVGGNKDFVTNWEVEFPILESAGVRGVAFYDAGNSFSETENFFQSAQRGGTLPLGLFHAVGTGIRWFSPLGPLRFEVGFPLTRRAQDDPYVFEFTIGNFF